MAKLFLKFEQATLKEVPLSQAAVTIGRLPDNVIQIDNLAVSGHHAKIYWDTDKYVVEDNNSLNGTYVNNARISKQPLKNGDSILIGKHTLAFTDEGKPLPSGPGVAQQEKAGPTVPKLEHTMMLDTKKMKEMLSHSHSPGGSQPPAPAPGPAPASATSGHAPTQTYSVPPPPIEKVGMLNVVSGKTDQSQYLLTSKMSVIGKSNMASIKLKGWFAPKMAAIISKRDTAYVIAASEKKIKVKVNGEEVIGQKPLAENDVIEVAGVKMTFGLQE
ncbi:MAG: FHA domain-containing protein [Acidobacteria bacterium]|nr:FHA domain-containing protein [Acidobacteriota bacterium]MBV9145845.1 FHA domain-containing protein [Acidobacteriota bacterium]